MLTLELSASWVFSREDILLTLHAGGADGEKEREKLRERSKVQYSTYVSIMFESVGINQYVRVCVCLCACVCL